MATTTTRTVDVSQGLASVIEALEYRVYWWVADTVRPPAVVIMQPTIDYTDTLSGFCAATWTFPMLLVVARNSDRDAQVALSTMVQRVASALSSATVAGVHDIAPVEASPTSVTVSGIEQPAYSLDVRVRA